MIPGLAVHINENRLSRRTLPLCIFTYHTLPGDRRAQADETSPSCAAQQIGVLEVPEANQAAERMAKCMLSHMMCSRAPSTDPDSRPLGFRLLA